MAYNFSPITPAVVAAAQLKPGYSDTVLFSPIDKFTAIQVPGVWAAAGDKKRITTAHTFGVSDGFISIKNKPGSVAEDGSGLKGEKGGQVPNHVYKFIIRGQSAVIEEILEELLNVESIYLFNSPECGVNEYVQLGSSCNPAMVTGYTPKSGNKGEGGVREYEYTVESNDKYWYTGTVSMKP